MSNVLDRICADRRDDLRARIRSRPLAEVATAVKAASPPRGFAARLANTVGAGGYGLIAEIKRASPSKGLIRADFDPSSIATAYAAGGATCLSVLTEGRYFQGDDSYLTAARTAVTLPVLRKDFLLDPYQILESRALGADCVLLIMAALNGGQAGELARAAGELGMDVLVEVHNSFELERALELETPLIGINNRNLNTLEVNVATTEVLAPRIPSNRLVVSESGLSNPFDLARMASAGVRAFLVGESLMRQTDVEQATRALLASPKAMTAKD